MMKAKIKVALVLSAGLALSACGNEAASTSSASASSSSITREAQPPAGSTSLCIMNIWSGITPDIQFEQIDGSSKQITGQGPLKFGATFCSTGYDVNVAHIRGRITLPEPYASLHFTADNPTLAKANAALWQAAEPGSKFPSARCIGPDGYSVGDRRTWDDGLLRYEIVREPDFGGKIFKMTIDRSAKPSADGKPARCPQ